MNGSGSVGATAVPGDKAAWPEMVHFGWPRSLAGRTLLTLWLGLAFVQAAGLTIHALDRIELQRQAELRTLGIRTMGLYRSLVATSIAERPAAARELEAGESVDLQLAANPPLEPPDPTPQPQVQTIRLAMQLVPLRPQNHPTEILFRGLAADGLISIAMKFPDQGWLVLRLPVPRPRPWHSPTFLLAFVLMTVAAALLSLWAVRRLTGPVAMLAAAAERLGRDVNSPPLPEDGPVELARAAHEFNTMAIRIRRFVQDRTFLLTAIGHDLKTPITRLKLRAEFIDDEEQRQKFISDLDDLDQMVSAALTFGRDAADMEPAVPLDLTALLRTVMDEAGDARPDCAGALAFAGPERLTVPGRPLALKRAFANLVGNALKYAGNATITLSPPAAGHTTIAIEDAGPGLPPELLDRVFDPFYRLEPSRNRETGGTGLGLPIARNILRAHGGDVTLSNRAEGGIRAQVTLPA